MAFKATGILPTVNYANIKRQMLNVKQTTQDARALFTSTTGADRVLTLMNQMVGYKTVLAGYAATPGIVEFAKAQEDDINYDVVAEYNVVNTALTAVIDEIVTTFPVATFLTINAGGSKTYSQFSSAVLADLRTKLDAVTAAIS